MTVTLPMSNGKKYELKPQKIICLGLNYWKHIEESAMAEPERFKEEAPREPILFPKTLNTLVGPESRLSFLRFWMTMGSGPAGRTMKANWP